MKRLYRRQLALRIVAFLVAFGLLTLLVFGILEAIPSLTCGEIVDKQYLPAHSYVTYHRTKIGDSWITTPVWHHVPDRWSLRILGLTAEGKERAEWWDVGNALYEKAALGDSVSRNPDTGVVTVEGGVP